MLRLPLLRLSAPFSLCIGVLLVSSVVLTMSPQLTLSIVDLVSTSVQRHEVDLLSTIRSKMTTDCEIDGSLKMRVVDMGCGYGSLLRHFWKEDLLWSGVSVDLSNEMCSQSRRLKGAKSRGIYV